MRVFAILFVLLTLPTIIVAQEVTPALPAPALLKNIDCIGTDTATGAVSSYKLTFTEFVFDDIAKVLLVSGILSDILGDKEFVRQILKITSAPAFSSIGGIVLDNNAAVCNVLTLNLGAISLDALGLVIDLAPVDLDITAVAGAGNLLGNLLCSLVGLLDGGLLGLVGGQGGLGGLSLLTAIIKNIVFVVDGLLHLE
jgi:hypothetical protein